MKITVKHFDLKKDDWIKWGEKPNFGKEHLSPIENAEVIKAFSQIDTIEDQLKYLYSYSRLWFIFNPTEFIIEGKKYVLGLPSLHLPHEVSAVGTFVMQEHVDLTLSSKLNPIKERLKSIENDSDRIEWIKYEIKELEHNIRIYDEQCLASAGAPSRKLICFYQGFRSQKRGMPLEIDYKGHDIELTYQDCRDAGEGAINCTIVKFLTDELTKTVENKSNMELDLPNDNELNQKNGKPYIKSPRTKLLMLKELGILDTLYNTYRASQNGNLNDKQLSKLVTYLVGGDDKEWDAIYKDLNSILHNTKTSKGEYAINTVSVGKLEKALIEFGIHIKNLEIKDN